MSKAFYVLWNPVSRQVGGFGSIDEESWQMHEQHLQAQGLGMIRVSSVEELAPLQLEGANNFVVKPDMSLEMVSPEHRGRPPIIIENTDASLEALNVKMDKLISLMEKLVG